MRLYVTTRPLFAPRYGGTDVLVELGPYRMRSVAQARAWLRAQRCVVVVDATLAFDTDRDPLVLIRDEVWQ